MMLVGVRSANITFFKHTVRRTVNVFTSVNTTSRLLPSVSAVRTFSQFRGGSSDQSPIRSFLSKGISTDVTVHPPTNRDVINADVGLQNFIKRTYLFIGASVAGSLGVSSFIASNHPAIGVGAMFAGVIGTFAGVFGIGFSRCTLKEDVYSTYTNQPVVIYSSQNSTMRLASFGVLVSSMGVALSPAFLLYPDAVTPALLASSTVFSSAVLYAYSRPVGSLSAWGPMLGTGLMSLLGVGFAGIASDIFLGPSSSLSIALHNMDLYLGIPLFTGFIAYDTHKAVQMYQERNPDHLVCAVELYLDFINIFIRFVEIIGKSQRDR